MLAKSISTRKFIPPQDDLESLITESLPQLRNKTILVVSSKIVAIGQGRCVKVPDVDFVAFKDALIRKESEVYLERDNTYPYTRMFTVTEGLLGSSAGIDESNGNGWYVLLPHDADREAATIRNFLMKRDSLTELGVVIVDSRTTPLRNGAIGVALGHSGFKALYDYRGKEDIFGRTLKVERMNVADCVASAGTLLLGEGEECTPLVVLEDVPHVLFSDDEDTDIMLQKSVPMHVDAFAQFFMDKGWHKGGAG